MGREWRKRKRVFMSAFLLPNAGRGQELNRVRHGRLVYTSKKYVKESLCVCVRQISSSQCIRYNHFAKCTGFISTIIHL